MLRRRILDRQFATCLEMRTYRFQLIVEIGPGSGFALHARSPRGDARGQFVPPFTPAETGRFATALLRGDRDLEIGSAEALRESLAAGGESLFSAVFQGEILHRYQSSLDLLVDDPEARLRLDIILDPREPRLAALQELPWELLRQPGTSEALALSRRRPLVRYLIVPKPVYAARRPAVLRILAIRAGACPEGLSPLDLARELRNLQEAVATARSGESLEIVEPEAPTLAALRQALLDKECQVLHFMGHGGRVPGQGERVLFFENEAGGAEPVRGTDLVNKLADIPSLRLAVLNACQSAATPEASTDGGFDPFSGVATSLVLGGLAAVVAMRLPISDHAAIAFSRAFYQRLAAGDPVDAAVAEGRQALHSAHPSGFEWATPVLFMRTRTGEIFPKKDIPPDKPLRARGWYWLAAALLVLALNVGGWLGVPAGRAYLLVAKGEESARHEQWNEARKSFQAAEKLRRDWARLQADLGVVEEKVGYLPTARDHYRRAVRLEPDSAAYQYALGSFFNRQGRYQEAYEVLETAVSLDPSRADVRCELASAALSLGLLGEARAILQSVLKAAPGRPDVHWLLGDLELRSNRDCAAIEPLNEAFRRYPPGDLGKVRIKSLLVQAFDRCENQAATCQAAGEFWRLDARRSTRWAIPVAEISTRRACPPER
jgi:tetratricopeptide (TPR) repeat protein